MSNCRVKVSYLALRVTTQKTFEILMTPYLQLIGVAIALSEALSVTPVIYLFCSVKGILAKSHCHL